jgi:hypothetical protein
VLLQPGVVLIGPGESGAFVEKQFLEDEIAILEHLDFNRIRSGDQHATHVARTSPNAPEDACTRTLVCGEAGHRRDDSFTSFPNVDGLGCEAL